MPEAVLIAGANGAGKTTFARHFVPVAYPAATFLNADEIKRLAPSPLTPIAAGREMIRQLEIAAQSGDDFAVETTLSSRQYARRIPAWKAAGYRVTLIFLEVPNADFAVARVALRVANGGHDIPEADIRRRYARGLSLFTSTYRNLADQWYWYQWNGQTYTLHQAG